MHTLILLIFLGCSRGFIVLSVKWRSQSGNATSMESSTIKKGSRFFHIWAPRIIEKFKGQNQSKAASIDNDNTNLVIIVIIKVIDETC